jgi:hypothetical protein
MLREANTVETGEQIEYVSASGHWQNFEPEILVKSPRWAGCLFLPYLFRRYLVSTDIDLPTPEINETVSTFFFDAHTQTTVPQLIHRNPEAVEDFLARYPQIFDFIQAAWPELIECFGGPVDIVLELITFPDESAHEELVGWIQSTDDVIDGLEKFERFEDEWFLDHMDKVGDKFNFNLETL